MNRAAKGLLLMLIFQSCLAVYFAAKSGRAEARLSALRSYVACLEGAAPCTEEQTADIRAAQEKVLNEKAGKE